MKKVLCIVSVTLLSLSLFCRFNTALIAESNSASSGLQNDGSSDYNANDLEKLISFLDFKDENGIKNGQKINEKYDPLIPETWSIPSAERSGGHEPTVAWCEVGGEMRLARLELPFMRELKGKLDLSGCTKLEYLCFRDNFITELDVSGCTSLSSLICYRNCLTSLNVSDCCQLSVLAFQENSVSTIDISHNPLLTAFCCDGNEIDSLDLSHNHELSELRCENNHITSLDLSNNPKLAWLWTDGNPLSKLDLSSNPQLCINKISSVGGGTACYNGNEYANSVTATSVGDIEFIGWFDAKDEVVSRDAEYIMSAGSPKELTAKFGAPMRGSVDEEDLSYVQERYSNYLLPIILSVTVVILAAVGAVTYKRLRSR